AGDLPGVLQAHVLPGLAGVGGLPDAGAVRDVAADGLLAAADVDDVRVRLADGDGADGAAEEAVGDVLPGGAAVAGAPDAAAGGAEVEQQRLAGHAGDGRRAAAAERADQAVAQPPEQRLIDLGQ